MTQEEYARYARSQARARRYKAGDTVMIDPNIRRCLIGVCVDVNMAKMGGQIFTVQDTDGNAYRLKKCMNSSGYQWAWQDYMLVDPVSEVDGKEILSFLE